METSHSNSTAPSLSARFAALKTPEPVAPSQLLIILAPLIRHCITYESSNIPLIAIMEQWYVKFPKRDPAYLADYCTIDFSSCCIHCGTILSLYSSCVVSHCRFCRYSPTFPPEIKLGHIYDLLQWRYKIHPTWIARSLSHYLEKLNDSRINRSTD